MTKNHIPDMRTIALAYNRAQSEPTGGRYSAWRGLADHCTRHAAIIRGDYLVIETELERPYGHANAMFRDLDIGRLYVSSANCTHPLWDERENVAFRICHDVLGHYAAHRAGEVADFSWDGEFNAYTYQARLLPRRDPRRRDDALFTEAVGQAAYALHYGTFGEQKVAFL